MFKNILRILIVAKMPCLFTIVFCAIFRSKIMALSLNRINYDIPRVHIYKDQITTPLARLHLVYGIAIKGLTIDLSSLHYVEYLEIYYDKKPWTQVSLQRFDASTRLEDKCLLIQSTVYKCENLTRIIELKGRKNKIRKIEIYGYDIKSTSFIGCFQAVGHGDGEADGLEECEIFCIKFPFYALKENQCHCTSNLTALTPADITSCQKGCPNKKFQFCGSNQSFALYKGAHHEEGRDYSSIDCINSLECPTCAPGRSGYNCETIDCSIQNGGCGIMKCVAMANVFSTCLCGEGYTLDDNITCRDIDECSSAKICKNGQCFNFPGFYSCKCQEGFYNINSSLCADINECNSSKTCDRNSTNCNNLQGDYECLCKLGYVRKLGASRKSDCQDFDECQSNFYNCPDEVACINFPGSYDCDCPNGSVKARFMHVIECEDVDECLTVNMCNKENSVCLNLINTYMCLCKPGYARVDFFTCAEYENNYSSTTDNVIFTTTEEPSHEIIIVFVIKLVQIVFGFLVLAAVGITSTYCYKKIILVSLTSTSATSDSKFRIGSSKLGS